MRVWFSDLDNTLIYSHRHNIPLPKMTAEYYHDREQSYITDVTISFLQDFCHDEENCLVPLTTRTRQQYERLFPLRKRLVYRYALIENGAVLLDNGQPDEAWEKESFALAEETEPHLTAILSILEQYAESGHVHDIRPFMVYAKMQECPALEALLRESYSGRKIAVLYSGGKLYCLPSVFSKGNAVRRFCRRFTGRADTVIASGDSDFDVSMLTESDIALYPEGLCVPADEKRRNIPVSGFFADGMCTRLRKIFQELSENKRK